jgi:hypothetical protein
MDYFNIPKRFIGPFGFAQCEVEGETLACKFWKFAGDPEQSLGEPDAKEVFTHLNFRLKSDPVMIYPHLNPETSIEVNTEGMMCQVTRDLPKGEQAFCSNDEHWIDRMRR